MSTSSSRPRRKRSTKTRSFRGVPAQVRKQERRERLLEAALSLYGARNYSSVTVRDVCGEAKLTERYFYESFENLEELFRAVFTQVHDQLKARTLEVLLSVEQKPMLLAETAVRAWFQFVREDPRRYRILLMDALSLHPSLAQHAWAANQDYVTLTHSFLTTLFPDGEQLHQLDGMYVAEGLVGINLSLARRWAQEEFQTPMDAVVRSALSFYRGLFAFDREERARVRDNG